MTPINGSQFEILTDFAHTSSFLFNLNFPTVVLIDFGFLGLLKVSIWQGLTEVLLKLEFGQTAKQSVNFIFAPHGALKFKKFKLMKFSAIHSTFYVVQKPTVAFFAKKSRSTTINVNNLERHYSINYKFTTVLLLC